MTKADERRRRSAAAAAWWAEAEAAVLAAVEPPQGLAWRPNPCALTWFGGDAWLSTRRGMGILLDPRPLPRDGEARLTAEVRLFPPEADGTHRAMLFCSLGNLAATGRWPEDMLRGNAETFLAARSPEALAALAAGVLKTAFGRAADAGEVRAWPPAGGRTGATRARPGND